MISIKETQQLEIIVNVDVMSLENSTILLNLIIDAIQNNKKDIVISLENISIIDSSGIAMLVKLIQHKKSKNQNIILANVSDDILKTFKMVHLDRFFKIQ